ncbi:helix-turn-helix domain-containing protein [Nocardia wallacei]|uniref:helix-turn-helix domain-containing protein n=1 Tax=Nocardia wallacei TaxID=480035 RepID=UPI001656AB74|nr:helix-turn-helix transcriptional regulator [Nocardia wallacei]
MADRKYDFGRSARMVVSRRYLGLDRDEMAAILRVSLSSYQRMENGQAGIPQGIWGEVDKLHEMFDHDVEQLLDEAAGGPLEVTVWRGKTKYRPFPGMWQRVVSEAMRENPQIEPKFPEDEA